jgi:hypothetical protein
VPCCAALSACPVERVWEDFDLSVSPFSNAWVDRDAATLEVLHAEGYECPDGRTARVYLVRPVSPPPVEDASRRPGLALLFHGRDFSYLDGEGRYYEDEDRLSVSWSALQAERVLGVDAASDGGAPEGAWVKALLDAGWTVAAPTGCWGDLWHGRGGNDRAAEGFLRQGAYLASDTARIATEHGVDTSRVIAIGLGEGGRAVTELALDAFVLSGVVVDASPDWLSPVVTDSYAKQPYIEGLYRIYADEIPITEDPEAKRAALRTALQRDTLVHAVQDLGWRVPIVYAWSALDERIDPEWAMPAADAISASYPLAIQQVLDWQTVEHAPSNRDPAQAAERLGWLLGVMGPAPL